MPDDMTVEHHGKKKKRKTGDTSLSDIVSYSEHSELDGSVRRKKKKKIKHSSDDETIGEMSFSNTFSKSNTHKTAIKNRVQEDALEQETSNCEGHSSPWESSKKRKRKKHIEGSVKETPDVADQTPQKTFQGGQRHCDKRGASEESLLGEQVIKKKKRHRPLETKNLEEEVLEDKQPSSLFNESTDVESSVRKKKKQRLLSETKNPEDVLEDKRPTSSRNTLDENSDVESSVRKKKKHRPLPETKNPEDVLEDKRTTSSWITLDENIDVESALRKKKKHRQPPETKSLEDVLEENTDVESSVRKRKKHRPPPETNNMGDVLDENTDVESNVRKKKKHRPPPETNNLGDVLAENTDVESSVRKKKKHTPLTETNNLGDVLAENTDVESSVRKKKKHRPLAETNNLGDVLAENTDVESSVRKKKKHRQPPETNNLGDVSAENSDVESSVRKKKKHTPLTETNNLGDILAENTDVEISVRKKKKHRLCSEIKNLEDVFEDELPTSPLVTLDENTHVESSVRKKKKKHRPPPETKNLEDVLDENSDVENSVRKTKKRHGVKEILRDVDLADEESTTINEGDGHEDDDNDEDTQTNKTQKNSEESVNQDGPSLGEDLPMNGQENILSEKRTSMRTRRPGTAEELLSSLRVRDAAILEEYFPTIRSWKCATVRNIIISDLERIKEAKRRGFKFETGRFDSEEDELIKKNVEDFRMMLGVESGEILLHSYRFPERKTVIERLKKKYNFHQRIAKGLHRTLDNCDRRAKKLYDLSATKGRFSQDEVRKIKEGVSLLGKNWTAIARLVGRSNTITQLKASQLKREVNGGKWETEEVNRLILAVKNFILGSMKKKRKTVPKEMLFTKIPWCKIEEDVQTRNWAVCKSKWIYILLLRMNNGVSPLRGALGIQTKIEIIKWLHEAELPRGRVDWVQLSLSIGNIPSGALHQLVYSMKSKYVPNWKSLSFKEIVDHLYTEYLPQLEAMYDVSLYETEMPEKKDEYLIKEIFREYSEDEEKALDMDD